MSKEQTTIFIDHIRENAARYFEGFESKQIEVRLEQKHVRPNSILYEYTVTDAVKNHGVIVKMPRQRRKPASEMDDLSYQKPELFPRTDISETHQLGYRALSSISEYFASLGEHHLGTIRLLDYLPEYQAVLTEVSKDPSLRKLFLDTNRIRPKTSFKELDLPLRNVGKWLRLYHDMSKEDNVQIRHENRQEYIEAICILTDFLGLALNDSTFFQRISATITRNALNILPESLPLGLGHGDFAMRNILIGANGRVTVLDTFAKWRTPIYEDIGYFLSALKLSALQVISQGLFFSSAQLSAYEQAFLEGYFEQKPIPYAEIRLYEMLSLLDKWSSVVTHYHRRGGKFKKFGSVKAGLTNQYFKRSTKRLVREISKMEKIPF